MSLQNTQNKLLKTQHTEETKQIIQRKPTIKMKTKNKDK